MPGWFAGLGRVFPGTATVASLYRALIAGRPVTAPWGTGRLAWLLVTAAAYVAAGIVAFRLGERAAKPRGTLARR